MLKESEIDIYRIFIENLNLIKLVEKLKSYLICLKICTRAIKILDLKYKFAETDPNNKVPLNLHGNSHSSPFEDSKYKYDMIKGFLN